MENLMTPGLTIMSDNRPTKVKIGELTYSVVWEGDAWFRTVNANAQWDGLSQIIHVWENVHPDKLACVFAHEIGHALAFHHSVNSDNLMTEERAADIASYGMVMVWRDNPDAFKWWSSLL
jgi:Zn-dependent peptidase ImmA (M78 family)